MVQTTDKRQEARVFKALGKNLEKRPEREAVTNKQEVIRHVAQASNLAGTRESDAKQAEMVLRSFAFLNAVR